MSDTKLMIIAAMGVGLAAVSAWLHINNKDGSGWGMAAFICWITALLSSTNP